MHGQQNIKHTFLSLTAGQNGAVVCPAGAKKAL
jgi:hypothetical protein